MASKKLKDTYSYKGWLRSDSFLKRAMAVVGYSFVGGMIIYAILILLIFVVFVLGAFFSFIF